MIFLVKWRYIHQMEALNELFLLAKVLSSMSVQICVINRVGYRNPVPTRHWYLWNRYVTNRIRMLISVPYFGAMPERSVEIYVLCFSETDVRSIISGTTRAKLFPD